MMNNCKAEIIEFYGLPGSGKSTISKMLINKLAEYNILCIDFNRYVYKNKRNFKALISGLFELRLKDIKLFYCYAILIIRQSNFKLNTIKKYFAFVRNHLLLKSLFNKNIYNYIILDQGFVQEMVSIAYNYNNMFTDNDISLKNFFSYVQSSFSNYMFIYVVVDGEMCKQRLKQRKKGNSTLDNVIDNDTYLNKLIQTHQMNFDIIQKQNKIIPTLVINSCNSAMDNANKIIARILQKDKAEPINAK